MRARTLFPLLLTVVAAGCVENTAPGNDREASLEPATEPAEMAAVDAALQNVATGAIYPQTMADADFANFPELGDRCVFRFTRVGFPALVYGSAEAVIKLNDKLIALPARGEGEYADGPVRVTVRPLEEGGPGSPGPWELVLRLDDAPNELGFHGFADC